MLFFIPGLLLVNNKLSIQIKSKHDGVMHILIKLIVGFFFFDHVMYFIIFLIDHHQSTKPLAQSFSV